MGVIKGQNLRITIGGKYVAFATSCTVHVSASLEDSSTKDSSDGIFQEQQLTGLSWDISTDALYSVDTDASGINAEGALDAILARQKVNIEFTIELWVTVIIPTAMNMICLLSSLNIELHSLKNLNL